MELKRIYYQIKTNFHTDPRVPLWALFMLGYLFTFLLVTWSCGAHWWTNENIIR